MKKSKEIKVLSLFDGISCARVALDKLGYKKVTYYSSETDKYAIQIAQKNWPNIIQMGDVRDVGKTVLVEGIDLLIGGSPCQDLSIAGKRKGLSGERSGLFWEFVRILKATKPKYFVLENVNSMPKEARDVITKELGVEPIMIDAALVSGQTRKRLFWTNIPGIKLPEDKGILLKDILENADTDRLKSHCIDANYYKGANWEQYKKKGRRQLVIGTQRIGQIGKGGQGDRIYSPEGKSVALSALGGGRGAKTGLYLVVPEATKKGYAIAKEGQSVDLSFPKSKTRRGRVGDKAKNLMTSSTIGVFQKGVVRKLTPLECERLQCLPDNYTEGQSNAQRYKACGNAFNVDVVAHILKNMV